MTKSISNGNFFIKLIILTELGEHFKNNTILFNHQGHTQIENPQKYAPKGPADTMQVKMLQVCLSTGQILL